VFSTADVKAKDLSRLSASQTDRQREGAERASERASERGRESE